MIPSCPITGLPLTDPVVDPEGNTYERNAILHWLETHPTSPLTRQSLSVDQLVPNRAIQALIAQEQAAAVVGIPNSQAHAPTALSNVATAWQVFLKTLDNRTLVLDVSVDSTVGDLKRLVQDRTGLSVAEQRLLYAGKELRELEYLLWADHHVPPQGTVHLVLRLRGGSK